MVGLAFEASLGMKVSCLHDSKLGGVAEQAPNGAWRVKWTNIQRFGPIEARIEMKLTLIPRAEENELPLWIRGPLTGCEDE